MHSRATRPLVWVVLVEVVGLLVVAVWAAMMQVMEGTPVSTCSTSSSFQLCSRYLSQYQCSRHHHRLGHPQCRRSCLSCSSRSRSSNLLQGLGRLVSRHRHCLLQKKMLNSRPCLLSHRHSS